MHDNRGQSHIYIFTQLSLLDGCYIYVFKFSYVTITTSSTCGPCLILIPEQTFLPFL